MISIPRTLMGSLLAALAVLLALALLGRKERPAR